MYGIFGSKIDDGQGGISRKHIKKRKFLESENQSRKERKKSAKRKIEGQKETPEANHEPEGEPNPKRRKLDTVSIKKVVRNVGNFKDFALKWKDEEYLAESESLSISVAGNIIELFNRENTIPFIARYRSHLTGHLSPDKLRKVKATFDYIQLIRKRAQQLFQLATANESTPELLSSIQSARTLEELEFIGSCFKKDSKKSLADRARQLGLEPHAKLLLEGEEKVDLSDFVNPAKPGLEDVKNVKLGIQHIIADIISKNPEVHSLLEKMYSSRQILLQSKFKGEEPDAVNSNYNLYRDFSQAVNAIKPHQTLAINRGESVKELTVKIVIPDSLWQPLRRFCDNKWLKSGKNYELRSHLFRDSVEDAIKRLLTPLVVRRIRMKLKAEAENEALSVFAINLRQLLMTPPWTGHVVMGIDPGFANGCKLAVVSPTGDLLHHNVFYLKSTPEARRILKNLVLKYNCEVIALGNGTGCRDTEVFLSSCIRRRIFGHLNVSYTIIDEQAVSIYSCSPIAAQEFPGMDPKIVSAVSLARRLQNPLSEFVKVEPKHLGVGMYQHDVPEKRLESTLDEIVSECVSFVGVDINSASFYLLRRVAGLNDSKAKEIIKYRTEVCSFKCREDLKKVKGIKTRTFQQCAGFIRVFPSTARCAKHNSCEMEFNPLDKTCIHPESYEVTRIIADLWELDLDDLGSDNFVEEIKRKKGAILMEQLAECLQRSVLEVEFIIDSLMKPKDYDMRVLSPGRVFRKEIKNLEDLTPGQVLDGVVRNVVSFGAFVDIGVGHNGLIHSSNMGNHLVQLNDRVEIQDPWEFFESSSAGGHQPSPTTPGCGTYWTIYCASSIEAALTGV